VAQGHVFVTERRVRPEVERVLGFEEATGKLLWAHSYPCSYQDMEYGNGPRASPTVYDGKVYTLGAKGHLVCLDARRGSVVWKKDLAKDCAARIPQYGASAAPLIEGDLLIVIAGGQPDATVMAFDRNTGKERWKALKDRPAYSAPIAVTRGGRRQVIIWSADAVTSLAPATGAIYWQVPYKASFDPAQAVASPVTHGDLLLCLGAWNRGSLMLKLDSDKPAASMLWKTRTRPTTTFSTPVFQDERHFYAIAGDGGLCCFDASSGNEIWATREATSERFGTAHLTPNGDRVFLFNHKGQLILAQLTPNGYQELGRCLLVEPTAGYRAAGAETWAHPAYANKCVFARNDRVLVCASLAADKQPAVAAPKQVVKARILSNSDRNAALAYSPDGKVIAVGTWDSVKLLELSSGKQLAGPARFNDWVCAVAFSPDGNLLASAGGSEFKPARNAYRPSAEVRLWDRRANVERGRLVGHTNKVLCAVFSPDGQTLATGSADQTVRLWDLTNGKERGVLRGHSDAVSSLAFSPDSKTVATAGWDGTVKLWDVFSGKERGTLHGHEDEVLAVAISGDGSTLASGGADWSVHVWDLATGQTRGVLKGHQGAVNSLNFSRDGTTLATGSGDETVRLWELATQHALITLRGHRSGIAAVAFSPDGRILASAGTDDSVRLWELPGVPRRDP
jgi:WD40 repeat protein